MNGNTWTNKKEIQKAKKKVRVIGAGGIASMARDLQQDFNCLCLLRRPPIA